MLVEGQPILMLKLVMCSLGLIVVLFIMEAWGYFEINFVAEPDLDVMILSPFESGSYFQVYLVVWSDIRLSIREQAG